VIYDPVALSLVHVRSACNQRTASKDNFEGDRGLQLYPDELTELNYDMGT
jgi:hypothetical protein